MNQEGFEFTAKELGALAGGAIIVAIVLSMLYAGEASFDANLQTLVDATVGQVLG